MHTWTAGGGCVEGTRIIKTTQNDRNLLNGNNMADSFEKQQPVGAKEEENDERLLRLIAWLIGNRTVCKKIEGTVWFL